MEKIINGRNDVENQPVSQSVSAMSGRDTALQRDRLVSAWISGRPQKSWQDVVPGERSAGWKRRITGKRRIVRKKRKTWKGEADRKKPLSCWRIGERRRRIADD